METIHTPTRFLKSGWRNVYAMDILSPEQIRRAGCRADTPRWKSEA